MQEPTLLKRERQSDRERERERKYLIQLMRNRTETTIKFIPGICKNLIINYVCNILPFR